MKEKKDNIRISEEQAFLNDLRGIVANGRRKGYEAVNQVIVVCNWLIGRRIVVQEQQGKGRAEYGKHVIDIASKYLTEVFGKGYSASNLRNYRQFYLMFGDLIPNLPNASGEFIKYSILHDSDQLFAAKYMTFLPKREELLAEIEYQKQIFLMQKSEQL